MLSIKRITIADIETLTSLGRETFFNSYFHLTIPEHFDEYVSRAFSHEKLLSELNNPDSYFYFAMLNNEVVGYLKLNFGHAQTEFGDENAMEIERIYLLKQHQGQQLGKQLLHFAIQTAKDKNLQYVWLGVWDQNPSAIRFYERNGFKISGNHTFTFGGQNHSDLMMKLAL